VFPVTERTRLLAMVEANAGRRLAKEVPIVSIDPAALREVIKAALTRNSPGSQPAEAQLDQLVANVLTQYDVDGKRIVVSPQGFARVPVEQRGAVARLAIAHELVHAIQDQELDLATYGVAPTPEGMMVRGMLRQGQALLVREQVARMLNIDASAQAVAQWLPGGVIPQGEAGGMERTVYQGGRSVIDATFVNGGPEAVWKLLASKPTAMADVVGVLPRSVAIESMGTLVGPRLVPPTWQPRRQPQPPSSIFARMPLTPEQRAAFVATCVGTDSMAFVGAGGAGVYMTSIRTKDAESALRIAELMKTVPGKMKEDAAKGGIQGSVNEKDFTEGERTFRISEVDLILATSATAQGQSMKTMIGLTWGNDEVIMVTSSRAPVDMEFFERIVRVAASNVGKPSRAAPADEPPVPPPSRERPARPADAPAPAAPASPR
jgi:hypothetical protein